MHGELPKKVLATPSRARRLGGTALVLIAAAGALYYVFSASAPQPQNHGRRFSAEGPVPVLAATATYADVPVYLTAVGTTKALNTVTVSPQVDGKLVSVNFKEGQDVKKGDVLARIDPSIYQAAYDQAVAKKAQDEALLANARADLERYEKLAATNAINKQQADTQRSLVAQYVAQVASDQAAIESAQATLGYTTIVAPIDGRTGIRQVDEGNIVHASSTGGIVTITQIKPISVMFNLPQQDLQQVNEAFAKGPLAVDALRSDTGAVIDHGKLTVIDNTVDASTGTVKLKAEFPNAEVHLWPGLFVNVRLLINTLQHVVTVPTGAVQRGPNGTFVYVIGDGGKVAMHPVKVQMQDENRAVITSGVTAEQQVVTTGFARLTDGAKVTLASEPDANAAPAAPAHKNGSGNGAHGQRGGSNSARPKAAQ